MIDAAPMWPVFQNHFDADAFSYSGEDMNLFILMNEDVVLHELATEEYTAVFSESQLNIPDVANYEVVGYDNLLEFYEIMMAFINYDSIVTLSDVEAGVDYDLLEASLLEVEEESSGLWGKTGLIITVVVSVSVATLLFVYLL